MSSRDRESSGSRRRRGSVTADKIVTSAIKLFGSRGYRATSISSIAADVGITDAGVLHHFPTKLDIFWAVVDVFIEQQIGPFIDFVAPGGLEAIRNLGRWGEVMEERPEMIALQVLLTAEGIGVHSELHDYYIQRNRDLRDVIVALFADGIARGEIRADCEPETEAMALLAYLDGARIQWVYSEGQHSIARGCRAYVDRLVARIAAQ
jgi:AcrR family transcriptional regulator